MNRVVLVLGTRQVLGTAVVEAFASRAFDVVDAAADAPRIEPPGPYAIVLVPPVLVCDHGDRTPRRARIDLDPFADGDPRVQGRSSMMERRLGSQALRHYIEAVAGPGTRLSMLSASVYEGPPLRGELEDVFVPGELGLALHTQLTILEAPLPGALPQLWSIDALPSVRCEGWGLTSRAVLHPPPPGASRRDQLDQHAGFLVENLAQLQRGASGLQLGEPAF